VDKHSTETKAQRTTLEETAIKHFAKHMGSAHQKATEQRRRKKD